MPAKTKKQQRFFQLVKAIQEGKADGSAKAKEVAESMNPESVGHYTKLEKESSQNANQLLRYAGLSALLGAAGAGTYGLSRYLYDTYTRPGEVKQLQREMNSAKGLKKEDSDSENSEEETEMLSDESKAPSDITQEDKNLLAGKQAAFNFSDFWNTKEMGNSAMYGFLTPLALFAPALMSYHFTKKYLDRQRNNKISDEVEEAKKEFEEALSEKSSALQQEIDSLFPLVKQAGLFSAPSWLPDGLSWTNRGDTVEAESLIGGPGRITSPSGETEVIHRPGPDPMGLLWLGGATAGLAGLGGYMLLKKKLEDDADQKKVKALKGLLKKDLAESALQSGVQVVEDEAGNKKLDI